MRFSRKEIAVQANLFLVGRELYSWVEREGLLEEVKRVAELIRERKARRGITQFKKKTTGQDLRKGCSPNFNCQYCYPEICSTKLNGNWYSNKRLRGLKDFDTDLSDVG